MPAKRWKLKNSKALAVIVALATLGPGIGSATSYKILHTFNGTDGTGPLGGVTLDDQGDLFGASASGGDLNECDGYGCGVVFELRMRSGGKWTEAVLYRFDSIGGNGYAPHGGLTIAAGKVYGTTSNGGRYDSGTVFEMTRGSDGWAESVLYSFGTHSDDGGEPTAGVVMDGAGNLYGTARTIAFELTAGTDGWEETILHRFGIKKNDGAGPFAGLISDDSGNLYGTTEGGGTYNDGTVYELRHTSSAWKERVLHSFDANGKDGVGPGGGALFMDRAGNLYGTTTGGGSNQCGGARGDLDSPRAGQAPGGIGNCGTIFELTKEANGRWKEAILYNFNIGATGSDPNAGVVMDKAGNLYGTTDYGGDAYCDCGVIYKLAPGPKGKWTYTVLHTFGIGDDGGVPAGNLVMDSKGNLYGSTVLGGTYGGGIVFELTP